MQSFPVRIGPAFTAALASLCLAAAGCTTGDAVPKTGPSPANTSASTGASPGIGAPGAESADTRGIGSVAPGEGAGLTAGSGVAPPMYGAGGIGAR